MRQGGVKRSFVLMEVVFSFLLAGLILGAGSSLILYFSHFQKKAKAEFHDALYKRALITRLRAFLGSMHHVKGRKPFILDREGASSKEKLLFMGDNGIFRDPQLANLVLYYLFVDEKGLWVAIHTDPERKKMDQDREVSYLIWPKATGVSFRFFGSKNLSNQSLEWSTEWKEDVSPLAIETTIYMGKTDKQIITTLVSEAIADKKPMRVQMSRDVLDQKE